MDEVTNELALAFEAAVVGYSCCVERREHDWVFQLSEAARLTVSCHWRLVAPERIVLTDEDHGQQFGLPEPVDAQTEANALLASSVVTSAKLDRLTADLCLVFSNGLRLDLFNNSSGYEGWEGGYSSADGGKMVIAKGGGGLTFF